MATAKAIVGGTTTILFHGSLLTKGEFYPVDHIYNWDGVWVAYVMNDDGALTWATTEHFEVYHPPVKPASIQSFKRSNIQSL